MPLTQEPLLKIPCSLYLKKDGKTGSISLGATGNFTENVFTHMFPGPHLITFIPGIPGKNKLVVEEL